ncbi:MAG: ParA family protein [Clostridia bacterium]|nr:ParA family protein [Clostridia bacterium]
MKDVMTKIICFANNKGGSGKSTTASCVGVELARLGKRVLLVDCDGQMNLTLSCFSEEEVFSFVKEKKSVFDALFEGRTEEEVTVATADEGLYMIPGSPRLCDVELRLAASPDKDAVLSRFLAGIAARGFYHAILIDAPPTLGAWVRGALRSSQFLVIPVEASPWGLYGLANMLEFCAEVAKQNEDLTLLGVAVTKADERKKYFKQTMENLRALKGVRVFETYIHVDSHVEWAQENSRPVTVWAPRCRAAEEYRKLAKEIWKYAGR